MTRIVDGKQETVETVHIPAELGAHLFSKKFLDAFMEFKLTSDDFDLLWEWTLLQAKLHSMGPPLRVAKAVQYTKLRHYEVAGGLLHELLRLRGMATGPGKANTAVVCRGDVYRGFPIIRRLRASFSGILKGFQPIIRKFVFVA